MWECPKFLFLFVTPANGIWNTHNKYFLQAINIFSHYFTFIIIVIIINSSSSIISSIILIT